MKQKQTKFRRLLLVAVVIIFGAYVVYAGWSPRLAYAQTVPSLAEATQDANWMMGAVLSNGSMNGAITHYPASDAIRPYQSNLGALGLVRASQITGDQSYVNAVWSYLNWYGAHMDANGYVTDYDLIGGTWQAAPNSRSSSAYDSTDSYAATFLLAVRAAYATTKDSSKLNALHGAVTKAVQAIHSTQQSDGLTWATPSFHVKYLADNSEAYQGLLAGKNIADLLSDTTLSANAASYASAMSGGIESLWNSSAGSYDWAKHENGVRNSTDWSTLYPDAFEQAHAVAFKIATGSRATSLMNQLESHQPNWDDPSAIGNNYDFTMLGWGHYNLGNTAQAQSAAASIRSDALANNRAWPFNIMSAGELIVLETEGEGLVFNTVSATAAATGPSGQSVPSTGSNGSGGASAPPATKSMSGTTPANANSTGTSDPKAVKSDPALLLNCNNDCEPLPATTTAAQKATSMARALLIIVLLAVAGFMAGRRHVWLKKLFRK